MKNFYIIILAFIIAFICSIDIFDSCKKINKIIRQNNLTIENVKIEK